MPIVIWEESNHEGQPVGVGNYKISSSYQYYAVQPDPYDPVGALTATIFQEFAINEP